MDTWVAMVQTREGVRVVGGYFTPEDARAAAVKALSGDPDECAVWARGGAGYDSHVPDVKRRALLRSIMDEIGPAWTASAIRAATSATARCRPKRARRIVRFVVDHPGCTIDEIASHLARTMPTTYERAVSMVQRYTRGFAFPPVVATRIEGGVRRYYVGNP